MINKQPPEHTEQDAHGAVQVHSLFYTIQGEGPFAGTPAIFIRLAGCNLQCPFCDTDYTSERNRYTPRQLVDAVHQHNYAHTSLVVLTGGEPFRQDISKAVEALKYAKFRVQIETNGTLYPLSQFPFRYVNIVCSPKTAKINQHLVPEIGTFKYVVEAGKVDKDGLPTDSLGMGLRVARPPQAFPNGNIFVQPLDSKDEEQNKKNIETAVNSCLRHGYRLCLQTQKLVGLP